MDRAGYHAIWVPATPEYLLVADREAFYVSRMNTLQSLRLPDLAIDDERSFRHVGLYAELAQALLQSDYEFLVLPEGSASWDRAVFLNLTFWGASGGDVLPEPRIAADVVAHVAWHHLANKALVSTGKSPTPMALFFGEAIASAFDIYLVGRLIGHAPKSSFLESQVPAMFECAESSGVTEQAFEKLIASVVDAPESAFEDLRELLFDATSALFLAANVNDAHQVLSRFSDHRFACLLHRHEISNWVLFAKAYGFSDDAMDSRVLEMDRELRAANVSLDWLAERWIRRQEA